MSSSLKRPKTSETIEDILKQQQEFLKANKLQKTDENDTHLCDNEVIDDIDNDDKDAIADNHDIPTKIVTSIVERNVDNWQQFITSSSSSSSSSSDTTRTDVSIGFPKAQIRDRNLVPKSGKSLFAQQMAKRFGSNSKDNINVELTDNKTIVGHIKSTKSVVTGVGLGSDNWKNDIHNIRQENELMINKLDSKEIEEMRRDLITKLSEKSINYLTNKFKKNEEKQTIDETANDIEMNDTIDENDLPIKPTDVEENKWLHMDVIEPKKMSWIGNIKETNCMINDAKQVISSTEKTFNARFDFEGNLIDKSVSDIDVHSGLFHHQLDESSAGYTIQELYTLIQSTFSSQKVLGLQVLSKLLTKAYNGLYDECFDESLNKQLMQNSALVLVTRLCLDDNTGSVWRVAISALHAMLCNTQVDELFLDRGFTLFTQCLKHDNNVDNLKPSYDSTKIQELSDEELLKLDIIYCLVKRTSLLQRIRYLLEIMKTQLDLKAINDLLDILIRIARHSSELRHDMMNCPYLFESIQHLMPVTVMSLTNTTDDKPNAKAIKLIRVLTSDDNHTVIVNTLVNTFPQLIESLKVYLTLNPDNCLNSREILEVSIESLRLWITLMSQNLCVNDFWQMFPIIIRQLQYCSTLDLISHQNNFDLQYASTLVFAIKTCVHQNREFKAFNELILMTAMKWLTLIKNTVIVPNFDANLCLLSVIEYLLISKYEIQLLQTIILQILESKTFQNKLLNLLIDNSNLIKLNAQSCGRKRDSSNLPSYGSVYNQTLDTVPILNNESPICIYLAFIQIIKTSTNIKLANELYIIDDYISKTINNLNFETLLTIFDCYELNALSEMCGLIGSNASVINQDINMYINSSILMLPFIKSERFKQNLLNCVIFNKELHLLSITDNMSQLSLTDKFNLNLNKMDSIKLLYIKNSKFDCLHWLFDPLLKSVQNKSFTILEMTDCLTFVSLVIKRHNNYYKQMISTTSVLFCFISSVFLTSEEMFFDETIQKLMFGILKILLSDGINCQIQDRVPYYETCGDFFVRFMDQFESTSYGNKLFINYLLVFCQTKCSSLFRTKLFTEYLTTLRIIKISFNEISIPIDNFLTPIESDSQTLESYMKALLCGALQPNDSPILYLICIHHLNHNLFRQTITDKIMKKPENMIFDRLIRSIHNSKNVLLKEHLLKYSHFDPNKPNGLAIHL